MPERADTTGHILTLLTKTTSGLQWLMGYFDYQRTNIAAGNWDDAAARQQFRDAVIKTGYQPLYSKEKLEDTVDWDRVYEKCWKITEPRDYGDLKEFRKRLERGEVDLEELGWD